MAKTKEELKELREKFEILNNKLKELTKEELEKITGGISTNRYKYSYRRNDYVFLNGEGKERFMIDEDVDTNDDGYVINGHKSEIGVRERDVRYDSKTASAIYSCYTSNGGKLKAME